MAFTKTIDGNRLAALRGKRSREWVAHELRSRGHATDAKAIWRWENGHNQPNARVLPDYAEVLGAPSVEDLYSDDEEEDASMPSHLDLEAVLDQLVDRAIARREAKTAA
jgi:hypothetical protein